MLRFLRAADAAFYAFRFSAFFAADFARCYSAYMFFYRFSS